LRKKYDWEKIKNEYLCSESATLKSIAKKYGLKYQTVKKHSAEGEWAKQKRIVYEGINADIQKKTDELIDMSTQSKAEVLKDIDFTARRLLHNIDASVGIFEKPSHLLTLAEALDKVKTIIRDVNSLPSLSEQQRYELAKEKLEILRLKSNESEAADNDGGVVYLAEAEYESED